MEPQGDEAIEASADERSSAEKRSRITEAVLASFYETSSGVGGVDWAAVSGWMSKGGSQPSETFKLHLADGILSGPGSDGSRRMDIAWLAVMASKMLKDGIDPMPAEVLLSLVLKADRPCLKGDVLASLIGPLDGYRCLCSGVLSHQVLNEASRSELALLLSRTILRDLVSALGTFAARQMGRWTLEDVHAVCLAARYAYSRQMGLMSVAGIGGNQSVRQDHDRFWSNVARKLIEGVAPPNRDLVVAWVELVAKQAKAEGAPGNDDQARGLLPVAAAGVGGKRGSPASKEVATYLPMPDEAVRREAAKALKARFPWADGLISRLFSEIDGRAVCGSPLLGFSPKLLIAPARGGKTDFVRRLAQGLGIPTLVITPGARSDFDLQSFMDDCKISNPMVVIDGVDRLCEASRDWRDVHAQLSWLIAALDERVQLPVAAGGLRDVRPRFAEVNWVMTAQSIEPISDALLQRLQKFKLPQPSHIHVQDIARNRLNDLAAIWRVPAEALPAAEVLDLNVSTKTDLLEQVCLAVDASALHWGGVRQHAHSAICSERYIGREVEGVSLSKVRQGDRDE